MIFEARVGGFSSNMVHCYFGVEESLFLFFI